MGRDVRKMRIAARERQRRYRAKLRERRQPSSATVSSAIRAALAEAWTGYAGPDTPAITHFVALVEVAARRRLGLAGYDLRISRERVHRALIGEDFEDSPAPEPEEEAPSPGW